MLIKQAGDENNENHQYRILPLMCVIFSELTSGEMFDNESGELRCRYWN